MRPDHLKVADEGIPGEVTVVEELGSESFVHVDLEHLGETLDLVVRGDGETDIRRSDTVHTAFAGPIHLFGPDEQRLE